MDKNELKITFNEEGIALLMRLDLFKEFERECKGKKAKEITAYLLSKGFTEEMFRLNVDRFGFYT